MSGDVVSTGKAGLFAAITIPTAFHRTTPEDLALMGDRMILRLLTLVYFLGAAHPARALPSFAAQTGQQCDACHVGSFGPQLTALGRRFKLTGYTATDGGDHFPPLAAMVLSSFTHTNAGQAGGAAPGFGANNNFALDQVSLFYGGRLFDGAGAFVQATYDGVGNGLQWDQLDLRWADKGTLADKPLIYGVTINNNPTVQDLWNSTPAWGFPFAGSALAPTPAAGTLIDGALAQQVIGLGAYASWNDLLYVEVDGYRGLSPGAQNTLGIVSSSPPTTVHGIAPYWRVALEHDFGKHYAEIGTYGLRAKLFPGALQFAGTDQINDFGVDATYQYTPSPLYNISVYGTYIREDQTLRASRQVVGSRPSGELRTLRANVSFTYANTYTVNLQHFETFGSANAGLYGTPNGSPNSAGWVSEVDYVPSGKLNSFVPHWLNVKLGLQYVAYTRFDGSSRQASRNNTFYSFLWLAVPLN
jgi:hypothetical protein